MAIIFVNKENRDLQEVSAQERLASTLADPNELKGVRRQFITKESPFIALLEEPANHYSSVHYHTDNEVMVVLEGRMMLNGEWCETGAVVYLDAGEEYWHSTGAEPCLVALIRPRDRSTLVPGADHRAAVRAQEASV